MLLAVTGRASSQIGALEVAVGEEVAPRWAALQLPGAAPELDDASEALVVFTVPDDACPEALAGLGELSTGVLEPELVRVVAGCDEPLIPRTYAVAVDRTALPADGATVRLPAQPTFRVTATEAQIPPASGAAPPPSPQPPAPPVGARAGTVTMPDPGTVESALLDDGAPVWVVAPVDSSPPVVLAATAPRDPEDEGAPAGAETLVRWQPSVRRFSGGGVVRDDHGRAVNAGPAADLPRHLVEPAGEQTLAVGGLDPRPAPGDPVVGAPGGDEPVPPQLPEPTSLAVALDDPGRAGPGWAVVDLDVVTTSGAVRICDADSGTSSGAELRVCPPSAPSPAALTPPPADDPTPGVEWSFGPLLMQVDEAGGVGRVALLGGGYAGLAGGPDPLPVAPDPTAP